MNAAGIMICWVIAIVWINPRGLGAWLAKVRIGYKTTLEEGK